MLMKTPHKCVCNEHMNHPHVGSAFFWTFLITEIVHYKISINKVNFITHTQTYTHTIIHCALNSGEMSHLLKSVLYEWPRTPELM